MAAIVGGVNLTKISNRGQESGYALNGASLEVYPGEMVALGVCPRNNVLNDIRH